MEKKKRGRPSAYKPEYAKQAEKLCKLGAIDKEIAEFFGVSVVTLNAWKKEFPEFLKSLKSGKLLADAEVADKLYQRAIGYKHRAVKIMVCNKAVVREIYTEHYAPDTAAMCFWLKNRKPELWRDNPVEGGGQNSGEVTGFEVVPYEDNPSE